jgi:hypothetical protein
MWLKNTEEGLGAFLRRKIIQLELCRVRALPESGVNLIEPYTGNFPPSKSESSDR